MNGIIRYKTKVFPSKKLPYKYLYSIKTRDTIYGIHKNNNNTSKTSLLLFIEKKYALMFTEFLENNLKKNIFFDRVMYDNNENIYISNAIPSRSVMPLQLQKNKASELELLSIIHYFDILIVSKTDYLSDNSFYIYGFDFIIDQIPNRRLIEYQLNNIFFNQHDK